MGGRGRSAFYTGWHVPDAAAPIGERCAWPGCACDGRFPAPRSRNGLRDYLWLCLDHVRAYNARWNYYAGMSEREIEADVRADVVWQRPSWPLGGGVAGGFGRGPRIGDGFAFFNDGGETPTPPHRPTVETHALMVLDLTPPVTITVVKARYKELVKRYHPDATGGDKAAEERFKEVSEAYRCVMRALKP
jgi:hypothetical protein